MRMGGAMGLVSEFVVDFAARRAFDPKMEETEEEGECTESTCQPNDPNARFYKEHFPRFLDEWEETQRKCYGCITHLAFAANPDNGEN